MNNRRKIEQGERIKKMTFIGYTEKKGTYRYGNWICDCGNIRELKNSEITSGHRITCGCGQNYNRKEPGVSLLNAYLGKMIANMRRRDIKISLDIEKIKEIVQLPCHYCGNRGSNTVKYEDCLGKVASFNGLDRVDSNLGYIEGNCVSCCKRCNWGKNSMSREDYLNHVSLVYNFNNLGVSVCS